MTAASTAFREDLEAVRVRIAERFGLVPSFFMLAREEPPIMDALFRMAEFAYFDSPLPALFKERLFTYVSRFCPVPYCMARHCGFLLGRGRVAGQAGVGGISPEAAVAMLAQPFPDAAAREGLLAYLRDLPEDLPEWPEPESEAEDALFQAAAVAFVMPHRQRPLLRELERVLGARRYNYLMILLAFVRFAHYWTEVHPALRTEDDIEQLLAEQRALAEWIGRYEEVVQAELGQQVQIELQELETLRARTRALEATQVELRREVDARIREAEAAEAASLAKSGFMATVSHELRTPLNAILGYVDLLEAGVAGDLGERAASYLGRIKATARHQQQIVEEILTFSRLEAGRETMVTAPVSLAELRDEIVAIISPLAEGRGLDFDADFREAPRVMHTDPGKLRQIVLNLLGNAAKFTERGYVRLTVERQEDGVTFVVADSGPGIREEDRARIFEPFTQGDESRTRVHGGTGLGLAITKRLVRLLGGTLDLHTVLGRGTTFIVRIPESSAPGAQERADAHASEVEA